MKDTVGTEPRGYTEMVYRGFWTKGGFPGHGPRSSHGPFEGHEPVSHFAYGLSNAPRLTPAFTVKNPLHCKTLSFGRSWALGRAVYQKISKLRRRAPTYGKKGRYLASSTAGHAAVASSGAKKLDRGPGRRTGPGRAWRPEAHLLYPDTGSPGSPFEDLKWRHLAWMVRRSAG